MRNEKLKNIFEDYQSGQVLLISLLVLAVALTVGLSVATRTISTNRMTAAQDSSQRAFSAAEAGLERALTIGMDSVITGSFSGNNSSYKTSKSLLSGDEILLNNGNFILKDDSADIWLSNYPDYSSPWTGTLDIYWGRASDVCTQPETSNTKAALEVILISGDTSNPRITHYAYDECDDRRNFNKFSDVLAGGSVKGKTFAYKASINVNSGLLARVVSLYAGTYIGAVGSGLPPQGTIITSVGASGGTQRKIVSFRGYPKAPIELYPFLIFSPK